MPLASTETGEESLATSSHLPRNLARVTVVACQRVATTLPPDNNSHQDMKGVTEREPHFNLLLIKSYRHAGEATLRSKDPVSQPNLPDD